MSYVSKYLQPGETVAYETRIHWIVYWRAVIAIVLAAAAFRVSQLHMDDALVTIFRGLAVLLAAAAVFEWLRAEIKRATTELAVTDRRIIFKTGLIRRHTYEMNRSKIESVVVDQGIAGRICDFGTVIIKGTGGGIEPLYGIDRPLQFRSYVTAG